MSESHAIILSHFSNSGIIQMPGRKFPGIVMQGDSLKILHGHIVDALKDAKIRMDDDAFYNFFSFAELLEGQLLHYEKILSDLGITLPYTGSINNTLVKYDYSED